MTRLAAALVLAASAFALALADGPADNVPEKVRRIPPPGVKVAEATRAELSKRLAEFLVEILAFPQDAPMARYLPDAEIFYKAVRVALDHDEFYSDKEIAAAPKLIAEGGRGCASWARAARRGRAPPGWSCAATARRSTAACSLTG